MAVTHEYSSRPAAGANGPLSAMCLEDKFELLREIGDGSFGSVALARVRTAGAHIARRGTMVGIYPFMDLAETHRPPGRYQDDEKDIRLIRPMFGTSRSHLPSLITGPCSSRPGTGNLLRPDVEEATHLYGAYGWKSVPADESTGAQMLGQQQREEYSFPDIVWSRPYSQS